MKQPKTYKTNYVLPSELPQAKTSIDLVEVIKKSDFDEFVQKLTEKLEKKNKEPVEYLGRPMSNEYSDGYQDCARDILVLLEDLKQS